MNEALQSLATADRLIHQPSRLIIMAVLSSVESADFNFLLRETGLSKGNLSSHLSRLEDAGYVRIVKSFRGRQPQTICQITPAGEAAFADYCQRLRRALDALPEFSG